MIYLCCDRRRRNLVAGDATLNGIDYLEVLDLDAPAGSPRQQTLLVRFIKPVPALTIDNLEIEGGERFDDIGVLWVAVADAIPPVLIADGDISAAEQAYFNALTEPDHVLVARTDSSGDYSPYRLRLVTSSSDPEPPDDIDQRLASIEFSFKVECPNDFDCKPKRVCPPPPTPPERIDYLAKDYASFRRLMLDRMALLTPEWTERSPADLGIALVELLAYVGDRLSYQQDAAATEAYLGTARRRISVRRHARLVDYFMSDGSNARAWVQLEVTADVAAPALPEGTRLFSAIPEITSAAVDDDPRVWGGARIVFETMEPVPEFFVDHNHILFYTWSDRDCCLPTGATSATVQGDLAASLEPGMVLVFEEVLGPRTGHPGDADPAHRHAVRLTRVDSAVDPLQPASPLTEICWEADDALPFPFCISATTDRAHGLAFVDNVSVARGNIVLADHGLTIEAEDLGTVPEPGTFYAASTDADRCDPADPQPVFPRFRPRLAESPVTQAAPYDPSGSARAAMLWDPRAVLPDAELTGEVLGTTRSWQPFRDLLSSDGDQRHFVAEIERDTAAILRFGDDRHGERPEPGTVFTARYRVGNGRAGNIGVDSLRHVAAAIPVLRVRNLTPGRGGTEPESMEEVRRKAPVAFRTQERAVTAEDYSEVTERDPEIQKAAASFRWTGSWQTVFLTVDRFGVLKVDDDFESATRAHVERYRMAGYDLEVDGPRPVSLEIVMRVCVLPDHFRGDVRAELEDVLSDELLPDGRLGVFHADQFTFGQAVYLSRIYAAAQAVPGVSSVHVTTFQRQDEPETDSIASGRLEMERLEIARLANDRNYPKHGVLALDMAGGK